MNSRNGEGVSRSDPSFTIPAEFIEKQLDKIANLDNITAEGIVEKVRWLDRIKRVTHENLFQEKECCIC